jgi:hypothetical protein
MKNATLLLFFSLLSCCITAQTSEKRLLKVYLDQFSPPEYAFDLIQEFPYVDYTVKPKEAEVQVMLISDFITFRQTRQGLCFFGLGRFEGQNDTIWYVIPPLTPELQQRDLVNDVFRRGIYPYLEQCGYTGDLKDLVGERPAEMEDLAWNKTQYSLKLNGFLQSEKYESDNFLSQYPNFKTNGYTINSNASSSVFHLGETWRYGGTINATFNQSKNNLKTDSFSWVSNFSFKNVNVNAFVARRLADHFSVGSRISYFNTENKSREQLEINGNKSISWSKSMALGAEYNFFSYSKYFQKRLLFGYDVALGTALTLADTRKISPWTHFLSLDYYQRVKWGYLEFGAKGGLNFNFDNFNTFSREVHGSLGFYVGKSTFLTISSDIRQDNNFSASKLGFSSGLFVKQGRHLTTLNMLGLTYLFGSGVRNNQNVGLDGIKLESVPSFYNDRNREGWNRWAYSLGGSGFFSSEDYKINYPNLGKIVSINRKHEYASALKINRIGRKFRNSTVLEYLNYGFKDVNPITGISDELTNRAIHFFQNAVYNLNQKFSIGVYCDVSNVQDLYFSRPFRDYYYNQLRKNVYAGVEYNFISYKHFFRKRLTFSYYHQFYSNENVDFSNVFRGSIYRNYRDKFEMSAFKLLPWGYISSNLDYGINLNSSLFKKQNFNAELSVGRKVSKSLFFVITPKLNFNKGNFDNFAFYSPRLNPNKGSSYGLSFGLDYYFGRGKTTVINPRMSRL